MNPNYDGPPPEPFYVTTFPETNTAESGYTLRRFKRQISLCRGQGSTSSSI